MKYLLDTNVVIALLHRERRHAILTQLRRHAPGEVVTSAVVAHELYFGAAKSARPEENRRRLAGVFADLEPHPLTREDAKAVSEDQGNPQAGRHADRALRRADRRTARARGAVLVTNNLREFARVKNLITVDWLRSDVV